jgi:hypothetical protein
MAAPRRLTGRIGSIGFYSACSVLRRVVAKLPVSEALEYVDHFVIRNLTEICVVGTDGAEKVEIFKVDDLVGLAAQLIDSISRRHRHREN